MIPSKTLKMEVKFDLSNHRAPAYGSREARFKPRQILMFFSPLEHKAE